MLFKRYAVIGYPLAQSFSPFIHKAFAKQFNLNIGYERISVSATELQDFTNKFFSSAGGAGLNITAPHKEQAYTLLKSCSIRAQFAQAVNTIKLEADGSLYGDNTDGIGLIRDLKRHTVSLAKQRILILGAGGATRGILPAIVEQLPSRITIANRNLPKAQTIAQHFKLSNFGKIHITDYAQLADQKFDVIINATSAGQDNKLPPLPFGFSFKSAYCYDLNYRQAAQPFISHALSNGAKLAVDGLGMLVEQAAESFYLWHGARPDTDLVLMQLH